MARHAPIRYRTHRRSPWPLALGAIAAGALLTLAACSSVRAPQGVQAVGNFNVDRYAGHWYELARIDHRFEKGLVNTSAHYSRAQDGSVTVVNRGYDPAKDRWREAEGRARFIEDPATASLKVSFFGPFYGGYHVVALDDDYRWSMVVGSSLDYLWILSRTKTLPDGVRERLLAKAQALGVDVGQILWIPQDGSPAPQS
ncbi:MAG: lipocalin [Comamonadaceae bacterium]|nr:MAG: lipocalin [Comamonadaceae bacterium]